MQGGLPKQYLELGGQPILQRTLTAMLGWGFLKKIIVVLHPHDQHWPQLQLAESAGIYTVIGGAERCDSVLAGVEELALEASASDWVLIHDAARPCVAAEDVQRLRDELADDAVGGLLAVPVAETVKQADREQRVRATLDRSELWLAQTPQLFRLGPLLDSLRRASSLGEMVTDEAAAMESAGMQPRLVAGDASNIKITCPADLALAEYLLRERG
jgi:2-C-methyl-D-erythritol 4-phosphate cytidylyltransferase